jgi:hypothetical protein
MSVLFRYYNTTISSANGRCLSWVICFMTTKLVRLHEPIYRGIIN